MRRPMSLFIALFVFFGLSACGSPPTKSIRTTTTTTTVDDNGNSSATAHSELRSNVPVQQQKQNQIRDSRTEWSSSAPMPSADSSDAVRTVEESHSTDVDGTTTVRKRVTNY